MMGDPGPCETEGSEHEVPVAAAAPTFRRIHEPRFRGNSKHTFLIARSELSRALLLQTSELQVLDVNPSMHHH